MLRAESWHSGGAKILVVGHDLEAAVRELSQQLPAEAIPVSGIDEVVMRADASSWGCILLDLASINQDGLERLEQLSRERPGFTWLVWSREASLPSAIEAMKRGAVDVLRLPEDNGPLRASVERAVHLGRERSVQWTHGRKIAANFAQLSDSEKHVLSLVLQGSTNKEIATQLDCSLRTIESRRQRILRIMQTANVIELAVALARHGMVEQAVGQASVVPHWVSA
jgi:two-component system response regulator FixJ